MARNILVQLNLGTTPSPTAIAKRLITVTDGAGQVQTATLDGSESPAWSTTLNGVDDGAGSGTVQDQDAGGNSVGSPVSFSYDAASGTGGGGTTNTFPTQSVTVSPAP
jgi:hypothetical protein